MSDVQLCPPCGGPERRGSFRPTSEPCANCGARPAPETWSWFKLVDGRWIRSHFTYAGAFKDYSATCTQCGGGHKPEHLQGGICAQCSGGWVEKPCDGCGYIVEHWPEKDGGLPTAHESASRTRCPAVAWTAGAPWRGEPCTIWNGQTWVKVEQDAWHGPPPGGMVKPYGVVEAVNPPMA